MKKFSLVILALLFTGCSNDSGYVAYQQYKIVTPTGAPAIAMACFSDSSNFETVTDPNKILPMMTTEQVDIAVLPTNVGISAIRNKKVNYKIAGTITFGNFYIASTGNDKDGIMDSNDYIVSFQQGAVPDKIFHYVHGNELDNALHYVSSAQEAAKCLTLGKNLADDSKTVDYVLLAEPALTTVLSKNEKAKIYEDLQEAYKVKSEGFEIFQASLFVRSALNFEDIKNLIINPLKQSIDEMKSGEGKVKEYMSRTSNPEVFFGVNPDIADKVTINGNKLGLGYKDSISNKDSINTFLSLFGEGGVTDEDIAK